MTSLEAEAYHCKQIQIFAEKTEADLISAFTINYPGINFLKYFRQKNGDKI
jgi:hypothetical protein